MLTLITGLLASLSYASSDMFSQRVTRETRALTQMVWVLVTGVAVILPIALLVDGLPDEGEWAGAGLAVLAGGLDFGALFCLLRGLQVGDLGLVSALTSLQGAYVAVVVIMLGTPITPLLGWPSRSAPSARCSRRSRAAPSRRGARHGRSPPASSSPASCCATRTATSAGSPSRRSRGRSRY